MSEGSIRRILPEIFLLQEFTHLVTEAPIQRLIVVRELNALKGLRPVKLPLLIRF